jgi:hypothetical protein
VTRTAVVWIASAALWILILWASWQCVALNGDGASFFVRVASKGWFLNYNDLSRQHAIWLTQIPLVLGLKAGLSDLHWLARLYSLGTLAVPAVLYQFALVRAKDDSLLLALVIAAIAAVFMTTCLFSAGEYNTAYAVVVAAMATVESRREPSLADGIVLLLLGLVGIRSYEAFLYLGPLIAAIVLWRRPPDDVVRHAGLRAALSMLLPAVLAGLALLGRIQLPVAVVAAAAGLAAFARAVPRCRSDAISIAHLTAAGLFAAGSVVSAESLSRMGGLGYAGKIAVDGLWSWHNLGFTLALSTVVAAVPAVLLTRRRFQLLPAVPLGLLAALPFLLSLDVATHPLSTLHFAPRAMAGLVIAGAVGVAWMRPTGAVNGGRGLVFALALLVAVLPSTLFAAAEYGAMIDAFRRAVRSAPTTIAFADAPPLVRRFFWDPDDQEFIGSLSAAVRPRKGAPLILPPPEVKFEPLPDLRDYVWRD